MAYETKTQVDTPHNIILEGRERLSISGVQDVERFDEEAVVVDTSKGMLIIKGSELHVEKLSLDSGDLSVQGQIQSLHYEEELREKGSLLSRLFK
ncbi:MAG: sporulation protein YabP [Oscillospiraceae bacterium]|nr:sporulation protein YabP [Oscillospiraceae bacterium]